MGSFTFRNHLTPLSLICVALTRHVSRCEVEADLTSAGSEPTGKAVL